MSSTIKNRIGGSCTVIEEENQPSRPVLRLRASPFTSPNFTNLAKTVLALAHYENREQVAFPGHVEMTVRVLTQYPGARLHAAGDFELIADSITNRDAHIGSDHTLTLNSKEINNTSGQIVAQTLKGMGINWTNEGILIGRRSVYLALQVLNIGKNGQVVSPEGKVLVVTESDLEVLGSVFAKQGIKFTTNNGRLYFKKGNILAPGQKIILLANSSMQIKKGKDRVSSVKDEGSAWDCGLIQICTRYNTVHLDGSDIFGNLYVKSGWDFQVQNFKQTTSDPILQLMKAKRAIEIKNSSFAGGIQFSGFSLKLSDVLVDALNQDLLFNGNQSINLDTVKLDHVCKTEMLLAARAKSRNESIHINGLNLSTNRLSVNGQGLRVNDSKWVVREGVLVLEGDQAVFENSQLYSLNGQEHRFQQACYQDSIIESYEGEILLALQNKGTLLESRVRSFSGNIQLDSSGGVTVSKTTLNALQVLLHVRRLDGVEHHFVGKEAVLIRGEEASVQHSTWSAEHLDVEMQKLSATHHQASGNRVMIKTQGELDLSHSVLEGGAGSSLTSTEGHVHMVAASLRGVEFAIEALKQVNIQEIRALLERGASFHSQKGWIDASSMDVQMVGGVLHLTTPNGRIRIDQGKVEVEREFILKGKIADVTRTTAHAKEEIGVDVGTAYMAENTLQAPKLTLSATQSQTIERSMHRGGTVAVSAGEWLQEKQTITEADRLSREAEGIILLRTHDRAEEGSLRAGRIFTLCASIERGVWSTEGHDVSMQQTQARVEALNVAARADANLSNSTLSGAVGVRAGRNVMADGLTTHGESTQMEAGGSLSVREADLNAAHRVHLSGQSIHGAGMQTHSGDRSTIVAEEYVELVGGEHEATNEIGVRAGVIDSRESRYSAPSFQQVASGPIHNQGSTVAGRDFIQEGDHVSNDQATIYLQGTHQANGQQGVSQRGTSTEAYNQRVEGGNVDQRGSLTTLTGGESSVSGSHVLTNEQTRRKGTGSYFVTSHAYHTDKGENTIEGLLHINGSSIRMEGMSNVEILELQAKIDSITLLGGTRALRGSLHATRYIDNETNTFFETEGWLSCYRLKNGNGTLRSEGDLGIHQEHYNNPGNATAKKTLMLSTQRAMQIDHPLDVEGSLFLRSVEGGIGLSQLVRAQGRGIFEAAGILNFQNNTVVLGDGIDARCQIFRSDAATFTITGDSRIVCDQFLLLAGQTHRPTNLYLRGDLYLESLLRTLNDASNFLVNGSLVAKGAALENRNRTHLHSYSERVGRRKKRFCGVNTGSTTLCRTVNQIIIDGLANTQIRNTAEIDWDGTLVNDGIFATGSLIGRVGNIRNTIESDVGRAPTSLPSYPTLFRNQLFRPGGDIYADQDIDLRVDQLLYNRGFFHAGENVRIRAQHFVNEPRMTEELEDVLRIKQWGRHSRRRVQVDHLDEGGVFEGTNVTLELSGDGSNRGTLQALETLQVSAENFTQEAMHVRSAVHLRAKGTAPWSSCNAYSVRTDFEQARALSGRVTIFDIRNQLSNTASEITSMGDVAIKAGSFIQRTLFSDYKSSVKRGVTSSHDRYSIIMSEGSVRSMGGNVSIETTTGDIDFEGAIIAGQDIRLQSARDVWARARTHGVDNRESRTKFTATTVSFEKTAYNTTESSLPTLFAGGGISIGAERDIDTEGLQAEAGGDIALKAGREIRDKGHEVRYYRNTSGLTVGVSFFGSQALEALARGSSLKDVAVALVQEDPAIASLYKMAQARGKAGVAIQGLMTSLTVMNQALDIKNGKKSLGEHFGLTDGNGNFDPAITVRISGYKESNEWTQTFLSHFVAGGNISAESNTQMWRGTQMEAGGDVTFSAAEWLEFVAESDTSSSRRQEVGASASFTSAGLVGGGIDYAQSNASSTQHMNASVRAGGKLSMQSGSTVRLGGFEGEAESVEIEAKHLHIEDMQDTMQSSSCAGSISTSGATFSMDNSSVRRVNAPTQLKARDFGKSFVRVKSMHTKVRDLEAVFENIPVEAKSHTHEQLTDKEKHLAFTATSKAITDTLDRIFTPIELEVNVQSTESKGKEPATNEPDNNEEAGPLPPDIELEDEALESIIPGIPDFRNGKTTFAVTNELSQPLREKMALVEDALHAQNMVSAANLLMSARYSPGLSRKYLNTLCKDLSPQDRARLVKYYEKRAVGVPIEMSMKAVHGIASIPRAVGRGVDYIVDRIEMPVAVKKAAEHARDVYSLGMAYLVVNNRPARVVYQIVEGAESRIGSIGRAYLNQSERATASLYDVGLVDPRVASRAFTSDLPYMAGVGVSLIPIGRAAGALSGGTSYAVRSAGTRAVENRFLVGEPVRMTRIQADYYAAQIARGAHPQDLPPGALSGHAYKKHGAEFKRLGKLDAHRVAKQSQFEGHLRNVLLDSETQMASLGPGRIVFANDRLKTAGFTSSTHEGTAYRFRGGAEKFVEKQVQKVLDRVSPKYYSNYLTQPHNGEFFNGSTSQLYKYKSSCR